MDARTHRQSGTLTLIVLGLLLTWILGKGLFASWVVGDMGPPTWDYRTVADIPAESPYAIYQLLPYPQHVRGMRGE